jgi:hypothetical protein
VRGLNCGLAKRPDRLMRLPESPHLSGAEAGYHLVIAISAKNFPKLEVARLIGLAKMKS